MSVQEAVDALRAVDSDDPAVAEVALAALEQLRDSDPAHVRDAVHQLAEAEVAEAALAPDEWSNWNGVQRSIPLEVFEPQTQALLRDQMRHMVEQSGQRLKANAAGHSTSAVARPDDGKYGINLNKLNKKLPRRWEKSVLPLYARGADSDLFRVQAGVSIEDLSKKLHADGLALPNTGSFDEQHVFGALCTGTHGSGLAFPTLADIVMSLEMFAVVNTPKGKRIRRYRIERTDGITDPAKLPKRQILVQDDDVFNAAVVSFGTFGVVTALTLKVVKKFWLRETREFMLWSALKPQLSQIAHSADHVDIHINPYRKDGDNSCVIIRRQRIPWKNGPITDRPNDQEFLRFFARTFGTDVLGKMASEFPAVVANGIDGYCKKNEPYEGPSYKVLITGYGRSVKATSSEFAVSLGKGGEMVQTVLDAAHSRRKGPRKKQIRHSSPLGLRFVKRSTQLLSQHADGLNATLEIPFVKGTRNREQSLDLYESLLSDARPHWGQRTSIDGARAAALYGPKWTKWLESYDRFNTTGVFNNRFTDQLGIDR